MRIRVVSSSLSRNQACLKCRSRKVRCSAERPACNACRRSANARREDPSLVRCMYISPPPWGDKEQESEEGDPIVADGCTEDGDKNERYSFRKTGGNLAGTLRESPETVSIRSFSKAKLAKPTKANSVLKNTQKRKRKPKATESETNHDAHSDAEGDTGDDFTSPPSLLSMNFFATHSSAPSSGFFPSPLTSAAFSPLSIQTTYPPHAYSANEYSNVQGKAANKLQTVANQVEYCAPVVHDYASFPDLHRAASPALPSSGNLALFRGNGSYPVTPGVDVQAQMQLQCLCLRPIEQPIDISPLPPAMSLPTPGLYLPPLTIQATTSAYMPVSQTSHISHIHALPHQTPHQLSVAPAPTSQTFVPVNYQGPV
ncbi:hypothetical protein BT69DRAFT_1344035 [Atractiella rhizophila]|nr:hypothetical protein BT69DRAFT_1344035 [Atractiella rhizophila]